MKKIHILMLSVLLVFQTLLAPLSVLAEGEAVPTEDSNIVKEDSGGSADASADVNLGSMKGGTENGASTTDASTGVNVDSIEGDAENDTSATDASTGVNVDSIEGDAENDASATDASTGVNVDSIEGDAENDSLDNTKENSEEEIQANSMQNDVKITFNGLSIGKKTISNAEEAKGVQPVMGEQTTVSYGVEIKASQGYGKGSTFTFELPPALLNFEQASLSGPLILNDGDLEFSYTTIGKIVTVTLDKGVIEEENQFNDGLLEFKALFSEFGAKEGFDQELSIPLLGTESITLPFTFKPKVNADGQPINKTGNPRIEGNKRYIDWTVTVNSDGQLLKGAEVNDTLGDGHKIVPESIKVKKIPFTLSGKGQSIDANLGQEFPLKLEEGYYEYVITYSTEVTRTPKETTERFTNQAVLTNNGGNVGTSSIEVSHTYGKKLTKELSEDSNKYNAKWTIGYNYFGSVFEKKVIRDEITGPHIIKEDSIQVYSVTVNAAGEGTKGTKLTNQPKPVIDENKKGFSLELASPNGEAYIIEYETELEEDFYVGNGGNAVINVVKYDDETDRDSINLVENIFSKSQGTIDYDKKEITWHLNINAEKDMTDVVIEDTFKEFKDDKTHQTLDKNSFKGLPEGVKLSVDDETKGFTLEISKLTKDSTLDITYKTKFDIMSNGSTYGTYSNIANLKWNSTINNPPNGYTLRKEASYNPGSTPTGKNGYKNGKFDHVEQKFNWNLAVNINKQQIKDAVVEDVIGEGHKLIAGSIEVYKLKLTNNDIGSQGDLVKSGIDINRSEKGFSITFTELTTDAYIIKYQTEDEDEIIGHKNGGSYKNNATFTTIDQQKFPFEDSASVKHANKLIVKEEPSQNPEDETITWIVKVNESHSTLGDEVTLTDTMSKNQMILSDKFEIREIKMDKDGNISYGSWEKFIPEVNLEKNSFTHSLDLNKKGWEVKYVTYFTGGPDDEFSNKATISYAGEDKGASSTANQEKIKFHFNESSGSISAVKGDLSIKKLGYDPENSEYKLLDDVTFKLLNRKGNIVLQEAQTKDGIVTFENIRYGIYQIVEEVKDDFEYTPLNGMREIRFNEKVDFKVNNGKYYDIINEKSVPSPTCTEFELKVFDEDGKPITDNVVLTNIVTGDVYEKPGTSTFSDVLAGKYKVKQGDIELGEITVNYYTNCADEIAPTPTCETFTIVLKEKVVKEDNTTVEQPRGDVTVTLKDAAGNVVEVNGETTFTTDKDGRIILTSSVKGGIAPGDYTLYEGQQYLGEVPLTYKEDCGKEFIVTQVPKCPSFTLTVKDVDGKVAEVKEVVIKDEKDLVVKKDTTNEHGVVVLENLKPGQYKVYDEKGELIGPFSSNTDCKAEVQPAPKCEKFTITIKDANGVITTPSKTTVIKDAKGKEIAGTLVDGKLQVDAKTTPAGEYSVYDKALYLGEITISYLGQCATELQIPEAPTCPDFTLTIKDMYGNAREGVTVTLTDEAGNEVKVNEQTDVNGKITIDNSVIKAGKYTVKEGEKVLGTITVGNTCEATIQPPRPTPPTPTGPKCDDYTVTVQGLGEGENTPRPGVEVQMKNAAGTIVATGTTNKDGKIVFPRKDFAKGEYTIYIDGAHIKVITITDDDCDVTVAYKQPEISCPNVTVTVKDEEGNARPNVDVTIKDSEGKIVTTGKTNEKGEIKTDEPLTPGKYEVYEGDTKIGEFTKDKTTCEYTVQPSKENSCPNVTVTVKDEAGNARPNVDVTIKDSEGKVVTTGKTNEKGEIKTDEPLTPGKYEVYEGDKKVGEFTKDKTTCEYTVQPGKENSCPNVTVTVKDEEGNTRPNVEVTIKDSEGKIVTTGKTNEKGEIKTDEPLTPGKYEVYEGDTKIGEFTTDKTTCEYTVQPGKENSCPNVTVTVKDEAGNARPNVDVTIKDSEGKIVTTGKTNEQGEIKTDEPLTPGKYEVYEGDKKIGEFTKDKTTCEYTVQPGKEISCPNVTVTVKDSEGNSKSGVAVTIQDKDGRIVLVGVTDGAGKVVTTGPLASGKYDVFINDEKAGEFTKDTTSCEYTITSNDTPSTGGGTPPTEPGKPGEEKPTEPGKPGEEKPTEPGKPGEEKPTEPGKPGEEKPTEPGKPGEEKPTEPGKPGEEKPTEPGKPGEEKPTEPGKPGEEKPTEPGKPGEEKPTEPGKPGEEKPTEPGKPGEEKPTEPGKPGEEKPTEPGKPGEEKPTEPGKPTTPPAVEVPTTGDKVVVPIKDKNGNPVVGQEYVVESADGKIKIPTITDKNGNIVIDKSKLPNGTYQIVDANGNVVQVIVVNHSNSNAATPSQPNKPSTGGNNAPQNKLPQTDGESTTAMMFGGLLLLAMGVLLIVRRRKVTQG